MGNPADRMLNRTLRCVANASITKKFPVASKQPGVLRPCLGDIMQHSFVISIDERRLRLFRALFDANGLPYPETMRGCTDPGINPV